MALTGTQLAERTVLEFAYAARKNNNFATRIANVAAYPNGANSKLV